MKRPLEGVLLSLLFFVCTGSGILKSVLDLEAPKELQERSQLSLETEKSAPQQLSGFPGDKTLPEPEEVEIDWKGRVVAIGDIHGDLKSLITSLILSGIINKSLNWIASNTLLIQLGDVVDRGSHALQIYKLFDKLRSQAPSFGGRFVGLLGNHEVMNLCGQLHYVTEEDIRTYGGRTNRTFEWSKEGFVGKYLRTMKLAVRINDSLYVHAGLLPKYAKLGLRKLDRLSSELLQGDFCDIYSSLFFLEDGPLWTRDISLGEEEKACDLVNKTLQTLGLSRMVVGHTIQHDNRINIKCNGQLVLADTGFSEAIYGKPCMLEALYAKDSNISDFRSLHPYSMNELQVKSNHSSPNIKYIQVTNILLSSKASVTEETTPRRDEF